MSTLMRPTNDRIARKVGKKLSTYEVRGHLLHNKIRIDVYDPNTHIFIFTKVYVSFDHLLRDWATVEE